MFKKLTHLIMKLENLLPIEIGLSVTNDENFIIFTGRFSNTVHLRFLKEYEEIEIPVRKLTPEQEANFPLITPIKHAESLDELSARRIRKQIDLAVMEMTQAKEMAEIKRVAKENKTDQEVTLKIA